MTRRPGIGLVVLVALGAGCGGGPSTDDYAKDASAICRKVSQSLALATPARADTPRKFDKQVQIRMGQANVRRWLDDILPLAVDDSDPLGLEEFATHRLPLEEAPQAYADFQAKRDGMVKVLFQPELAAA